MIFKRKGLSYYKNKEDNWQLVPKINEEDFDSIYYDLINFRFNNELLNKILEDEFKYSKQFIERYNLKDYIKPLSFKLNTSLENIIDENDFIQFLFYSNYHLNSQESIRLTIRNLLTECFDSIIDLNIKILFLEENNEYFKRFNPFIYPSSYEFFVIEEIIKKIKNSHSYCGSIRFQIVEFNSILSEYFLRHSIKIRENFHELNDYRELIIHEINRIKLIYKKHKYFDFLKNYVKELEEILNDFDKGFHLNEINKLEYSTSDLGKDKVVINDKLTSKKKKEITEFLQNWFRVNSEYDARSKINIKELLNLNFEEIKNDLILRKSVKSFSLFFYFLFKKHINFSKVTKKNVIRIK